MKQTPRTGAKMRASQSRAKAWPKSPNIYFSILSFWPLLLLQRGTLRCRRQFGHCATSMGTGLFRQVTLAASCILRFILFTGQMGLMLHLTRMYTVLLSSAGTGVFLHHQLHWLCFYHLGPLLCSCLFHPLHDFPSDLLLFGLYRATPGSFFILPPL